MGTLALIGIRNRKMPQEVKYVTLCTDGYISEAGLKLMFHYNATKKAHDLIEKGQIVQLKASLEDSLFSASFKSVNGETYKPIRDVYESAFYNSDKAAIKYLFADGEWHVFVKGVMKEPMPLYEYMKSHFEKIDIESDQAQEKLLSANV